MVTARTPEQEHCVAEVREAVTLELHAASVCPRCGEPLHERSAITADGYDSAVDRLE